jgi:hypothetical protein
MNGYEIATAVSGILPVTWVNGSLPGTPGEGWFLINVNPLPPSGEVEQVVSDICEDRDILLEDGQVRHYPGCSSVHHSLKPELRKVINLLNPQNFKVAVHPGIPGRYNGQPLAIAIDPVISYANFPDHPHLNVGGKGLGAAFKGYLPDSLCYLEDVHELGSDPTVRFRNVFFIIAIWLFRHMVWEAQRKLYRNANWIGPEGSRLPDYAYALTLDPLGPCRCGSQRNYFDCHMMNDIQKRADLPPAVKARYMKDPIGAKLAWETSLNAPNKRFVSDLIELFALHK